MLFHRPEGFSTLKGCWKRAQKFGHIADINPNHPLFVPWMNVQLFLDADDSAEKYCFDAVLLDWFACKVDEFSKNHILEGDDTVSAILHEWKKRMPFDPTRMN